MKRLLSSWMLFCILFPLWAQVSISDYYREASGQQGAGLKTALYNIITGHTERSYANLWDDFTNTDVREDGKVWDMYSSVTDFTFVNDQCGNYSGEGDCYNREHSFPKSWFNDATPMYTDLFHLYPTDGYVNGMRSNYPFGETDSPSRTSQGGFSRLGPSSVSGYSGIVFEPADEYKGDFARTYFYMVTCYENRISGWESDMLDGKTYPGFADWAIDMLLRWAADDPVSEKETARNEAVYRIQKNRNPYIDFPGLEQYVWGDKTDVAFDPDNYGEGSLPADSGAVAAPTFTPQGGSLPQGSVVTITTSTQDAYIVYSINGGSLRTEEPPVYITIDEAVTIEAYAMKDDKTSTTVVVSYTISDTASDEGIQTFRKVASADDLQTGCRYLIVCEDELQAMGAADDDIRSCAAVTVADDEIRTATNGDGLPYQFVLGLADGAYVLQDAVTGNYLALESSQNKLHEATTTDTDNAQWYISISGSGTVICNKAYTGRSIQYNANAPRFACYASQQRPVCLYLNITNTGTAIPAATADTAGNNGRTDVYTTDGRRVRSNVPMQRALDNLPQGIYIVRGKKIRVR